MIAAFKSRQFMAFLVTGGIAALVNFTSRLLLSRSLDFSIAVILAYVIGMVTAFVLAKAFVFTGGQHTVRQSAAFFVLVNLVAILQTWGISVLLAYHVLPAMGIHAYAPEIAHAVGIVVPVFTSYLGHKYWTFR